MSSLPILFLAIVLWGGSASAALNHPYDAPPAWALFGTNQALVTPMTATKDQNGSGLCYGFAATTLLENFICKNQSISDCNQLMLSVLHVSSFRDEGKILEDGGSTNSILTKIKGQNAPIIRESCAPFPRYKDFLKKIKAEGYKDADDFERRYNYIKSNPNCIECMNVMERALPHLNRQLLKNLISNYKYKEFLAHSVISEDCLKNNSIKIPPFEIRSRTPSDFQHSGEIHGLIEKLVLNKIPVQMSIQTDTGNPPGFHAIVIEGVKEVCRGEAMECVQMYKIKNSYGKNWEAQNNNGWVEAGNLIEHFKGHEGLTLSWLETPGQVLKNLALKSERKNYNPGKREDVPTPDSDNGPIIYNATPAEIRDESITWICDDGINPIVFTDQYKGKHCRPR